MPQAAEIRRYPRLEPSVGVGVVVCCVVCLFVCWLVGWFVCLLIFKGVARVFGNTCKGSRTALTAVLAPYSGSWRLVPRFPRRQSQCSPPRWVFLSLQYSSLVSFLLRNDSQGRTVVATFVVPLHHSFCGKVVATFVVPLHHSFCGKVVATLWFPFTIPSEGRW